MDLHDRAGDGGAPVSAELRALFADAETCRLAADAWLFRPGAEDDALYLLREGTLDVVLPGADGREQTLARFGPGAVLGEIAYLLGGQRSAGVRARERSVLSRLSRSQADRAPEIGRILARLLAGRLRATNALLTDLLHEDEMLPSAPAAEAAEGLPERADVAERDRFDADDLEGLLSGRLLAVRLRSWYTPLQAHRLSRRLLRHPAFSRYSVAPDVGVQRVGYSFFETRGDAERLARYFDCAVPTIHELRAVWAPLQSPIDRLRLELDERWPGGANLARMDGRPMFAGVARLFEDGHQLEPHQDILGRETEHAFAQGLGAQLTANIYLRTPQRGGELEIWEAMPGAAEAAALATGTHDFLDRARLGPPAVRIRPAAGELVLMLSSRIHAVQPGQGGPRISVSTFIGHETRSDRLLLWN